MHLADGVGAGAGSAGELRASQRRVSTIGRVERDSARVRLIERAAAGEARRGAGLLSVGHFGAARGFQAPIFSVSLR